MSDFIVTHSIDENKFFLMDGENKIGHLGYVFDDDTITVLTTFVEPKFRNGFVGKKLVDQCVEYARDNSYKIIPLCSFVDVLFRKSKRYDDVKKVK
jgi:predicted GNAT family acetyltransferase